MRSRRVSSSELTGRDRGERSNGDSNMNSIDLPILVLILVVGLIAGYGGWGPGRQPPRGPWL